MCTRCSVHVVQSVKDNADTLETLFKNKSSFMLNWLYFPIFFLQTLILLQCIVLSFRGPCNLNDSNRKQVTATFSAVILTPVTVEKWSKLT